MPCPTQSCSISKAVPALLMEAYLKMVGRYDTRSPTQVPPSRQAHGLPHAKLQHLESGAGCADLGVPETGGPG